MARSATTRFAVLGMLTRRPMTGYELRDEIGDSIGHFWTESFGQLYPTLRELTADGLVDDRSSGPRRRTEYSLTDSGRETLRCWLAEDVELYSSQRNELLLKLFFGRHVQPWVVQRHLASHRQALTSALARYRGIERAVLDETDPDSQYWLATLRYGIAVAEAGLAWTAETQASLPAESEAQPRSQDEEQ